MNIGEVLDQLRPDFPDVTISKIRFLEAEGLVEPERTPVRLPQVLPRRRRAAALRPRRCSATTTCPLKVISEHLDAIDRGLEPPPIEPVVADGARRSRWPPTACRAPSRSRRRDDLRLSRAELLKIAEIDRGAARPSSSSSAWSRRGPAPATTTPTPWWSPRPRASWPTFGLEPRHLRAFKTAADREVGLVEQVVGPAQARPRRRREGPGRGDRQRDRGAVGAAARRAGEDRPARHADPEPRPRSGSTDAGVG